MMTYDPRYEGNVPPEFLLNPEMMTQYVNMMDANIGYLESEIKRLDDIRLDTIEKLNELNNKQSILKNFLKFSKADGFDLVKENTGEIIQDQEEDAALNSFFDMCFSSYYEEDQLFRCFKPRHHDGPHGVKID